MLRCPSCNSHDLGKLSADQRYCWHCLIEMTTRNDQITSVYQVEEDGSLSLLHNLL